MELLIGCGSNREKKLAFDSRREWSGLVTLDIEACHKPDVRWDLTHPDVLPYDFADNTLDEIHAYHVLEHIAQQGDYRRFFREWMAFWRALKPGGTFFGICPAAASSWAWGDPGHTRIITPECLIFLEQPEYTRQVGKTSMADYRSLYTGDFDRVYSEIVGDEFRFALKAVKPSRIAYAETVAANG